MTVAISCYPLVVLLTLAPAGFAEQGEPTLTLDSPPSLVFRVFPGLITETGNRALTDITWAGSVLVFAGVGGMVVWAMLYRRARPQRLLAVGVIVVALFANIVPIAVGLYSYAAWFTDRRRLTAWTVVAFAAFTAGVWVPGRLGWSVVTTVLIAFVIPLSLGLWTGTRRQLVANLGERAAHLEQQQRLLAERAATAERTRIAREMHDVVAHRVSMMVLQAGGVEMSTTDPAAADAARHIRTTGRVALTELRQVLGVLREHRPDIAPTAPQPVLADIDQLVTDSRAAGHDVEVTRRGHVRDLTPAVERTAFRIAQEALTNAGKHAPGQTVRLDFDYGATELGLTATNDTATEPASASAGGYGLTGLHERVILAGGTLTAGELPDGRWQLHAVLPLGTEPDDHIDHPGGHR